MQSTHHYLSPAAAAHRLGVSAKALRLYEERGLLMPERNPAGWRLYGPKQMQRGADIVALRALGLCLAQVANVLHGQGGDLAPSQPLADALAAHQADLEGRARLLLGTIDKVRALRADLERGRTPTVAELTCLREARPKHSVAFDLPWPWGGEPFELCDIRALNYIVGPLGSGKTRLAMRLSEVLPGAVFVGLARTTDGRAALQLQADAALKLRVDQALAWFVDDGATVSEALTALLVALESEDDNALVIDLVEQGLDTATQHALAAHLQRRKSHDRPLFMLTRSNVILDLAAVGADETIILCPANHSPPTLVAPYAGAPGYEAVATCLAAPEVRARTEGTIAWLPGGRADFATLVSATLG